MDRLLINLGVVSEKDSSNYFSSSLDLATIEAATLIRSIGDNNEPMLP
jgi:hypothetical protein